MSEIILSKVCSKCKVEKPLSEFSKHNGMLDGLRPDCKACISIYNATYRKANSDKIAKVKKAHYIANRQSILEKGKERGKRWRSDNPEKNKERHKLYHQLNSEKISIRQKAYKQANPEKVAAQKKAWRIANIDYNKNYYKQNVEKASIRKKEYNKTEKGKAVYLKSNQKRRSIKRNVTIEDFNPIEVFERDKYICQICHKKTSTRYKNQNHPLYTNLDHIVPLSKGGEHSKVNCQVLCRKCNFEKHNKTDFGDQLRLFG